MGGKHRKPAAVPTDRRRLWLGVGLVVVVFVIYAPVSGHDFVNFDDDAYIENNAVVRSGLTAQGVAWAFRNVSYFYWQPLTWISHMIDCELYGLNAGPHHITSVLLHAANAVLLLLVLVQMTGLLWRSAAVAALFALHPLRVESVAWIAERKDLLAGLFWILTVWAYTRYVHGRSGRRYAAVLIAFAAGLMAKPTVVTLPLVLLLLDYWPLRRGEGARKLVLEKVPMFAMSAVVSAVTYIGQKQMGAMDVLADVPLTIRIANALVSYGAYLAKTFWPHPLAVLYPYRTDLPVPEVVAGAALVGMISAVAVWQRRKHPYLFTGWFWFAGVVVPNIGLVQVGEQAYGDRFTYLPHVGLTLAIVWGAAEIMTRLRMRPRAVAVTAGVVLFALAAVSRAQVRHWRDSITLFGHALEVTSESRLAHHNLAFALAARGRTAEAIPHYKEALRIRPGHAEGHYNLGRALWSEGRMEEARESFLRALNLKPAYTEANYAVGSIASRTGRREEAIHHFGEALRSGLAPEFAADAHNDLGVMLAQQGRYREAEHHFREVLRLRPADANAQKNLAASIAAQGRDAAAIMF